MCGKNKKVCQILWKFGTNVRFCASCSGDILGEEAKEYIKKFGRWLIDRGFHLRSGSYLVQRAAANFVGHTIRNRPY